MNFNKAIMSIGASIAASKLARVVSSITADDVLGTVGLSRRRSHLVENLLFLGAGAAVGVGTALLFAPATGRETRAKLGKEVSKLGSKASEMVSEAGESVRALGQGNHDRMGQRERTL